jgi:EAL domain-containing protein (putative c-di-GMP-specific phosphodiesterase class I)
MKELKAMGIRFSIDDFGTGYSSLSYLKKFPLNNLKIDRSFIIDIPAGNDSKTLARTIIVLAKELGLKIIAEGVERQDQLDFFTQNSEYLIQGFYYSKPLSFTELLIFLKMP